MFGKINMASGTFATAINCMDGRVQLPVIEWLKKNFLIDYVDMITETGPNKILSENRDNRLVESIKKRVEISVAKHHSKLIAIVGHYDCAGNPVEKDIQLEQILSAIQTVKYWNLDVQIIGLWVEENWNVSQINI